MTQVQEMEKKRHLEEELRIFEETEKQKQMEKARIINEMINQPLSSWLGRKYRIAG